MRTPDAPDAELPSRRRIIRASLAGLATLLTNALPIAAGTVVLGEPVPSGAFGGVRIVAFVAVTLGAILLARPDRSAAQVEATAVDWSHETMGLP